MVESVLPAANQSSVRQTRALPFKKKKKKKPKQRECKQKSKSKKKQKFSKLIFLENTFFQDFASVIHCLRYVLSLDNFIFVLN